MTAPAEPSRRGEDLTTDDHTCVVLLDSVVLRQVLATRDPDDIAMLLRLNLAGAGVPGFTGRFIGSGRHAGVRAVPSPATTAAAARHGSGASRTRPGSEQAARHAAPEPVAQGPVRRPTGRGTAAA